MIDEEITQADRDAAAAYMEVVGDKRWSIEGILSGGCDNTSIVRAFARHRRRHPQTEQGLSVGEIGLVYASAIEAVEEQQTDALKIARDALENAPIIGLTESAVDFRKRQDLWAYGQWKAAIKALKESK
jgi:hypothetical protein